jgi:hypothetical protein
LDLSRYPRQYDDAVGVAKWQWSKQRGVGDTEHRRGRSNAECERRDDDRRDTGRPSQAAECEPNIARETRHPAIVEKSLERTTRLRRRHRALRAGGVAKL